MGLECLIPPRMPAGFATACIVTTVNADRPYERRARSLGCSRHPTHSNVESNISAVRKAASAPLYPGEFGSTEDTIDCSIRWRSRARSAPIRSSASLSLSWTDANMANSLVARLSEGGA